MAASIPSKEEKLRGAWATLYSRPSRSSFTAASPRLDVAAELLVLIVGTIGSTPLLSFSEPAHLPFYNPILDLDQAVFLRSRTFSRHAYLTTAIRILLRASKFRTEVVDRILKLDSAFYFLAAVTCYSSQPSKTNNDAELEAKDHRDS